jgi:hypothetical protein
MTKQLPRTARDQAVASRQRCIRTELDDRFGDLVPGALISCLLGKRAPLAHNHAVAEGQQRIQMRISEIDIDVFEDLFNCWTARAKRGRGS